MPTTHVQPDAQSFLQDIANSLWKAKKVVVITGAGISTNSGIPDFRSENGLYSLIQAQFDAVAASRPYGSSASDAGESDIPSETVDERPSKRRRMSQEEKTSDEIKVSTEDSPELQEQVEYEKEGLTVDGSPVDLESQRVTEGSTQRTTEETGALTKGLLEAPHNAALDNAEGPEHAPDRPLESGDHLPALGHAARVPEGQTPLASPKPLGGRKENGGGGFERDSTARSGHFASSPPRFPLNMSRAQMDFERSGQRTLCSSPLSSPPPVLYDPYQELSQRPSSSSSSSYTGESGSSRFGSEEPSSTSTPLLTSQSSFGSLSRTSLPNLKGKDLFDAQIWSCPVKTSVFYTFATTLRHKVRSAEPTSSHQFVSTLRDSRKLVRCYTQNIDQLEERVGLTTSLSLGAGSRYRFSARAGRTSGGARGPIKDADSSVQNQSQPSSQSDGGLIRQDTEEKPTEHDQDNNAESSSNGQPTDQHNSDTDSKDKPKGDDSRPNDTESQGTGVESVSQPTNDNSQPTNVTSNASAPVPPTGPNRGVECVFLHGSLAELRCFVCARTCEWDDDKQADTLAGRQPICPHCAGATAAREERGKRALGVGKLRPDIVLYGEEHPHAHLISPIIQHDLSLGPDMLLILGTSMRVHGLKVLVKEFAKAVHDRGGKVVFVNFTKPPESVWSDVIDFWVQWDCDAWVSDLQTRKPALWLPPGTALPEDEKTRSTKASRRVSGSESSKRKDGGSSKRRESGGPCSKARRENSGVTTPAAGDAQKEAGAGSPRHIAQDVVKDTVMVASDDTIEDEEMNDAPEHVTEDVTTVAAKDAPMDTIREDSGEETVEETVTEPESTMEKSPPELSEAKAEKMAPPPRPPPRRAAPRAAREPRLNPDAKRPASVRDHKLNGAYLVWKITSELQRITGNGSTASAASSPVTAKPKPRPRKSRKSAPATMASQEVTMAEQNRPPPAPAVEQTRSPVKKETIEDLLRAAESSSLELHNESRTAGDDPHDSICAAVKTRKRKRTVTWKMVRGVETPVSLHDGRPIDDEQVHPSPSSSVLPHQPSQPPFSPYSHAPHTDAVFRPSPSLLANDHPRALPKPTPRITPAPPPRSSVPTTRIAPLSLAHNHLSDDTEDEEENGFSETDRLIAELTNAQKDVCFGIDPNVDDDEMSTKKRAKNDHDEGFKETDRLIARYNELASRPATPLQLPPLIRTQRERLGTGSGGTKKKAAKPVVPKLQPLEPKVSSPGPRAEISANVGNGGSPTTITGPPSAGLPMYHQHHFGGEPQSHGGYPMERGSSNGSNHNPFFYSDPLGRQLSFPPLWYGQGSQEAEAEYERARMAEMQAQGHASGHAQPRENEPRSHGYHAQQFGARLLMESGHAHHSRQGSLASHAGPTYELKCHSRTASGEVAYENPGLSRDWCPEEQLRKEQEAALMLSFMRGGGGPPPVSTWSPSPATAAAPVTTARDG